ncbi:TlpA family protein disulfide reductase [bacterium]|nr:TlpA family protein disulfide reductase [bacterium]
MNKNLIIIVVAVLFLVISIAGLGIVFTRHNRPTYKGPIATQKEEHQPAPQASTEKVPSGIISTQPEVSPDKEITPGGEAGNTGKLPPKVANCSQAPDFELRDIHNNNFRLSEHRGKVIILDFWTTWCMPCKIEIPSFIKIQEEFGDQGVMIVGVSLDTQTRSAVKPFADRMKINYSVLLDGREMAHLYGNISAIPTTFIIDQNGCIREKFIGAKPHSEFEGWVKKLLKEADQLSLSE